jgi:hypothetical protein
VRAGLAYNEDGRNKRKGSAAADFDGDGLLDISKQISPTTRTRYTRMQAGIILKMTRLGPVWLSNTKYLGWGTGFIDIDNDGWKDLIAANGHVYPEVDNANTAEKFQTATPAYWNRGDGQFFDISSEAGPGIV